MEDVRCIEQGSCFVVDLPASGQDGWVEGCRGGCLVEVPHAEVVFTRRDDAEVRRVWA